jgi:ribonuclease BN (tRNA processing enzyme)
VVEAGNERIVVDMGNGTITGLQRITDLFAIDAVLFSHLHPDHCADFLPLVVHRKYHPEPPYDPSQRKLPVYGPGNAASRFAAAYASDEEELRRTNLSDVFSFRPYGTGSQMIAGFTVTAAKVAHPCEAYGVRIERGGRSLCYTGDSAPCEALVRLADGVDTLLAEASWTDAPNRPPNLHMSGRQAGELAAKASVGRLVVTHVTPWTDREEVLAEARNAFPGEVVLAATGARYQI